MKVTVYDLQNAEHEMEAIDAKECVKEMGWTLEPQATVDPQPLAEAEEPARRGRKPRELE